MRFDSSFDAIAQRVIGIAFSLSRKSGATLVLLALETDVLLKSTSMPVTQDLPVGLLTRGRCASKCVCKP